MSGIAQLERLLARLREVDRIAKEASDEAGRGLRRRLAEQYDRGVDPTDAPWKPVTEETLRRRKVKHSPPPLTDTRAMRNNTRVTLQGVRGLRVTVNRPGGDPMVPAYHQPVRPIVPVGPSLPAPWKRVIEAAVWKSISISLK